MSKRQEIESRLREDAAVDPAFKEALKTDPERAIRERYGVETPTSISLRILEEARGEVIIILPDSGAVRLTEADLESASGGTYDSWEC